MLNFSPASENNKNAILAKLDNFLIPIADVLEVGSGSGQHAFYFASRFAHLKWQTSELGDGIDALDENIKQHASGNVLRPVLLDVCQHPWPVSTASAVYTANTLHIMPWRSVVEFFKGIGEILNEQGLVFIYGPFKYAEQFTTPSNEEFDQWLKRRNPESGVRDFEAVNELASNQNLLLVDDFPMPANNQFLVFKRD